MFSKKGIQQIITMIMLASIAVSVATLFFYNFGRMKSHTEIMAENQTISYQSIMNTKIKIDSIGENVVYVRNTGCAGFRIVVHIKSPFHAF